VDTSIADCRSAAQLQDRWESWQRTKSSAETFLSLLSTGIMQTAKSTEHSRRLSAADFDAFNQILAGVTFRIPDQSFKASGISVSIKKLVCGSVSFGDISLIGEKASNTLVKVRLGITSLAISCSCDWRWDWGWFGGSGSASGGGTQNHMQAVLDFTSANLQTTPPTKGSVSSCAASMDMTQLSFSGGITAAIANLFKGTVRGFIEGKLNEVACSELSGVGADLLTGLLAGLEDAMEPYRGETISVDALAAEKLLAADSSIGELMQVYDPESAPDLPSRLVSQGLHSLDNMLGSVSTSIGTADLGINHLVRSVTGSSGSLEVNTTAFGQIYAGTDPITSTSVSLTGMKVTGLDSFSAFDAFTILGKQTVRHQLAMERLDIEMRISLDIGPSTAKDSIIAGHSNKRAVEDVILRTGLQNLAADAATIIGIKSNDFRHMQIGSLLAAPIPCIISTIHALNFTSLHLNVGDIVPPTISGFISPGLERLFAGASNAAFLMYEAPFLNIMPNFGQSQRNNLNVGLRNMMQSTQAPGACPIQDDPRSVPAQYFNFQNSSIFDTITNAMTSNLVVDSEMPSATPIPSSESGLRVNRDIVGPLTLNQSGEAGVLVARGDLFATEQDTGLAIGKIKLRVSDLRVAGLNTINNLTLLKPVGAHELYNHLNLGAPRDLNVSVDVLLEISGGGSMKMRNHVRLSLSLSNLDIMLKLLIKLNVPNVLHMQLQHVTNINCLLSALAPEDGFGISQFSASIARSAINVDCISCSSPQLFELSQRLRSEDSVRELTDGVNGLFEKWSRILTGSETMKFIEEELQAAAERCRSAYGVSIDSLNVQADQAATPSGAHIGQATFPMSPTMLASVVMISCVITLTCFCCVRCFRRQRQLLAYQKVIDARRSSGEETQGVPSPLISETASLFRSDVIPVVVRYGLPLMLVVNIFFFLSGHLSLGATVDVYVTAAGEQAPIADFFTFSLGQSTIDMWNAGAKGLAVLIVLFSGLWPYTKIFISLFMWFASPSMLAPASRGSIFLWLDALGKWSMIDIFVLIMSMVAFHLRIFSPQAASIPVNLYFVEVMVEPVWGLYANMIAQLISQLLSHVAIHYHRNVIAAAELSSGDKLISGSAIPKKLSPKGKGTQHSVAAQIDQLERGAKETVALRRARRASSWMSSTSILTGPRAALVDRKECLYEHVYSISGSNRHIRLGCVVHAFILLLALTACGALAYGCAVPSFRIEIHGLAGLALDFGRPGASIQEYSIVTVFHEIMSQAQNTFLSQLGIHYIAIIFVVCALAAPVAQMLALVIMWRAPLTLKQLKGMLVCNEIIAAWQYLEVYLIAIVVSLLQIGQISGFMVGNLCDGIEDTLQGLARLAVIEAKHAKCFYVHADVEAGTYWLLIASLALNFLAQFVTRAAASAARDREARIKGFEPEIDIENRRYCFEKIFLGLFSMLCCVQNVVDELGNIPAKERRRASTVARSWNEQNPVWNTAQQQAGLSTAVRTENAQARNPQHMEVHWEAHRTPDGKMFYWNKVTGATQWERPNQIRAPKLKPARPARPERPPRSPASRFSQSSSSTAVAQVLGEKARAASTSFRAKLAKFRALERLEETAEYGSPL